MRRELGVREGDQMIVVSVAHNPVMGDVHSVCMVGRALGGPLPGVHVVFKLHPQERTDPPYERVLRGLAHAGGYEPPAMTSLRDIDRIACCAVPMRIWASTRRSTPMPPWPARRPCWPSARPMPTCWATCRPAWPRRFATWTTSGPRCRQGSAWIPRPDAGSWLTTTNWVMPRAKIVAALRTVAG